MHRTKKNKVHDFPLEVKPEPVVSSFDAGNTKDEQPQEQSGSSKQIKVILK